MRIGPTLLSSAVLLFSGTASAQYSFDLIIYDRFEVDESWSSFSSGSAIVVNTGSVPIPLAEWVKVRNYAKIDSVLGNFELEAVAPGPAEIAPGEGMGTAVSVLVSELKPGETLVSALTLNLQMAGPFPPGTTKTMEWTFVLGDQQVSGTTDVVFSSSPGPYSARRYSSGPATTIVEPFGSGCAGYLEPWPASTTSASCTVSNSSDLPIIGNHRFGIRTFAATGAGFMGFDLVPGSLTWKGCPILLGLSGAFMATAAGVVTPVAIPDDLGLIGLSFYAQTVRKDVFTGAWFSTDGLKVTIDGI